MRNSDWFEQERARFDDEWNRTARAAKRTAWIVVPLWVAFYLTILAAAILGVIWLAERVL